MEVAITPKKLSKEIKKKKCPICGQEKNIATGFYKSSSPLYADDGCVPICTTCVKSGVINKEDGTINLNKLKTMLQRIDKPYYVDDLDSSYKQYKKEHGFLPDEEVARHGKDIIGIYFKNCMLRQNRSKSFADSEIDGFIHQNSNTSKNEKERIINTYIRNMGSSTDVVNNSVDSVEQFKKREEFKFESDIDDFEVTSDIVALFGEGYSKEEYRKMFNKYEKLKLNYSLQTSLHQEALATYVRFKVKEEEATAKGDVDEAKKWYDAAQTAADKAKLSPKQLTQSDLQGGINNFSDIFKAVEQAVDVIPILPQFKFRPNDAIDFIIWCYINYARDLRGLPQCSYEDVYKFYDQKKKEYIEQYGDPNHIFEDDPSESLRENIKQFITLPSDYDDIGSGNED